MKLSIIVAASENNAIGRENDLPWRLSADLKRFKKLTMGHCLIMGRKTYDSIGRPLPGRVSIVLSRTPANAQLEAKPNVLPAASLEEACSQVFSTEMSHEEAFITGGGQIYQLALPQATRLYLTRVHTHIDGDAFFPEVDWNQWKLIESTCHSADEKNEHDYSFEIYERCGNA